MAKGYHGETCSDAIRAQFADCDILATSEIVPRVKACGAWTDETIHRHLIAKIVNLPPAHRPGQKPKPFLFLRPDGRFEMYDDRRHPRVVE
jgi:hypothetical protein